MRSWAQHRHPKSVATKRALPQCRFVITRARDEAVGFVARQLRSPLFGRQAWTPLSLASRTASPSQRDPAHLPLRIGALRRRPPVRPSPQAPERGEKLGVAVRLSGLAPLRDVRTTMIYTHIVNRGPLGVVSPLDR